MISPAPTPFHTARKRRQRSRIAGGFAAAAFLHARVAEDLCDRLDTINRPFERTLLLGGGGAFRAALQKRPELAARVQVLAETDLSERLVAAPFGLACDPEALPFEIGSFDLVVSNLALHWVNDLPGALVQLRLALKPDGLLLASLFGGETLADLRGALMRAEIEARGGAGPRVAPFADAQDLAGLLQRAGFALPVADLDTTTVRYRDPVQLFADLRAMGETAALTDRPPLALTRAIVLRALELWAQQAEEPDGRVRARFDVITMTGWVPHASQQKPLRPGSASARLADILGTTEHNAGEKAGGLPRTAEPDDGASS